MKPSHLYTKSWKIFTSISFLIPAVAAMLTCSRCSSDQQAATQQEPVNGQTSAPTQAAQKNAATAAQGEGMNNVIASGNDFGNPSEGAGAEGNNLGLGNAPTNVATTENLTAEPVNAGLNNGVPLNNDTALTNAGPLVNNAAPLVNNAAPLVNSAAPAEATAAVQATAPAAATAFDPAARAAASPFTNPRMNWPGKGKVKYALHELTRHSSANGPVVGQFAQGDHPLVFQNGNWAELNDGSFVKGNGLSDKGVGYRTSK